MKNSRFAETQIVSILKQADGGRAIKELCRKHDFSEVTYYNWKPKYGGLAASDLRRIEEFRDGACQAQAHAGRTAAAQ
jgi:putative transposase